MMEKPLAVNMEHARAIVAAATKGHIEVLVNYDTSWYPSTQSALENVLGKQRVGEIRKVVLRDGHAGPGPLTSPEFLAWLTDPRLNGGGALMDFGCYGANLLTVLMRNQRPDSVCAVTQTFRPDRYPKVDDEATIVVAYPKAVGIVQGSWNWPRARKDMDIYGTDGELSVLDPQTLVYRESGESLVHRRGAALSTEDWKEEQIPAPPPTGSNADEFAYLAAVVRGEVRPSGPSALATNLIVTEILDAARESARTGQRVDLRRAPLRTP
jgi:predicted dehydrogenase